MKMKNLKSVLSLLLAAVLLLSYAGTALADEPKITGNESLVYELYLAQNDPDAQPDPVTAEN